MDYVKFFGLECEPFQNDLDGRFYFEGSSQRRARQQILRAVQQRKGLALLLGGPGLGKTTLAHQLLRELDPQKFAAHLLLSSHRECARGWFLPQLGRAYGLAKPSARVPDLIEQIHAQLLAVRSAGRHPVLFVDEAQLLGEVQTLEEFRALLNLAHDGQRVFSLVLFGMEELGGLLALDSSLAQRVDVRARLAAFSASEAGAYLAHRLARAGGAPGLLQADAVEALHRYSGGVMRVLNTLADTALFEAALEECRAVGVAHVAAAAQQFDLRPIEAEAEASEIPAGEAAASFQASPAPAGEPDEGAEADEEPLFGESTAETLGKAKPDADWLEPVAPVLDAVIRSFDDETSAQVAPDELPAPATRPSAAREAPADDPLEWSLLDVSAGAGEGEAPDAPRAVELAALPGSANDDDSMANLTFADEELELGEADLAELVLERSDEEPAASTPTPAAARSKGPRIDLPEDDDLDSLFDEIQIET
jgi:type II secretory pathway predicted ATPase ExeA